MILYISNEERMTHDRQPDARMDESAPRRGPRRRTPEFERPCLALPRPIPLERGQFDLEGLIEGSFGTVVPERVFQDHKSLPHAWDADCPARTSSLYRGEKGAARSRTRQ